jgi:hypothetical protein
MAMEFPDDWVFEPAAAIPQTTPVALATHG